MKLTGVIQGNGRAAAVFCILVIDLQKISIPFSPLVTFVGGVKFSNILYDRCTFFLMESMIVVFVNAGAQTFPNYTFGWVNVKDVANAHVQAYEIPSASGRYLLVETVAHYSEIVRMLRELYPDLQLPDK